ncbi:hypothetical protein M0R88_15755 [Halorussus gelatinilyticus]|uniref:DUF8098 domain-containing protein n=1 Tax=Halorussus gelatinilyticus TaxID=2937524 RepID=A0A8U0IIP4_9EURY|nr:hypothetical protein [Halorussus gelatinilyticus]UPV99958.1 hypothetical protein M0R88_15755 [Halorussus gelatinilyticus]
MHPDAPPDESDVLEKVETALKQAVRDNSDLNWEYGTRIKRQKYTYLAVEHFTDSDEAFPVTYSWYKFGAVMPAAPKSGTVGPASTQMPTPDARESGIFTVAFDDIVDFFRRSDFTPGLDEDSWYASDLDFLEAFYESHAPEEYRDLYLGNVAFRQHLDSALEEVRTARRGSSADRSSPVFGTERYEDVGRAAARMHLGLVGIDFLSQTLDEVREFTNLVEDAFLVLSQTCASEVTESQVAALEELKQVYNEWIWEYPALLMSKETAKGPNAPTLRKWSAQKHFSVEDNLQKHIDSVSQSCVDVGLVPSSDQYPEHDDDVETIGRAVALQAMRRDE